MDVDAVTIHAALFHVIRETGLVVKSVEFINLIGNETIARVNSCTKLSNNFFESCSMRLFVAYIP